MFQFPGLAPFRVIRLATDRVAPFGDPGITACVQLPQAYRSLPRPSSPLCAKASTVRLLVLDLKLLLSAQRPTCFELGESCQRKTVGSLVPIPKLHPR